jgi:hypothetical protein
MPRTAQIIVEFDLDSSDSIEKTIQELNEQVFDNRIQLMSLTNNNHLRISVTIPKFISYHKLIPFLRPGSIILQTTNKEYKAIIYSPASTAPF